MSDHFHIIGNPTSEKELEDQWNQFQSEPIDHQHQADDECIRVHGQTNKERYEKLRSKFLKKDIPYPTIDEVDNMVHEEVEGEMNYHLVDYPRENVEKAKYWGIMNIRSIVYPTKDEDKLDELWHGYKSMIRKNQRESDWKSLELFGMDNQAHYEYLKSRFLEKDIPSEIEDVTDEVDHSTVMGEAVIQEGIFDIPKDNIFPVKSDKPMLVLNGHRSMMNDAAALGFIEIVMRALGHRFRFSPTSIVLPAAFSQYFAIDICNQKFESGDIILSANDGIVIDTRDTVRVEQGEFINKLSLFGNYAIIKHSPLFYGIYAHMETVSVKTGDKVKRGQPIGTMGTTGNSTGPHLHFEACILNPAIAAKLGVLHQYAPMAAGHISRSIRFDNYMVKHMPRKSFKNETIPEIIQILESNPMKWKRGNDTDLSDSKYIYLCTTNMDLKEAQLDKNDYVIDDSIEYFKDHISDFTSVPDEALPYYDADEIEYLIPDDSARYDKEYDMDIFSRSFSIREWRNAYKEFCENGIRFNTNTWEKEVARISNKLESTRLANKDTLQLENALLSLGWNPSIPFNEKTRMIGSIRYANKNVYQIVESVDLLDEASKVDTKLEPIYIVLVQGHSLFSAAIKAVTKGPFSHAAISLDHTLENLFSYNIDTFGLSPESVKRYGKDTIIGVYAVFVKPEDRKKIEAVLKEFIKNKEKTHYSIGNIFTFVAGVPMEKQFDKICSQFVDSVLKLADIDLTKKSSSLVSPNDFMYAAHTNKKIYKLFEGKCGDFNAGELKYKTNKLKKSAQYIKEAKELPIYFDDSGNLLIKNMRRLDFEHEYAACHKLLLSYEKSNNIEGMKYELSKLWFMNELIEKKRHDKNTKPEEKAALDKARAKIMNDFYKYVDIIQKKEPNFNFTEYYEESPFSDAVYKVRPSTLKFTIKTLKDLVF